MSGTLVVQNLQGPASGANANKIIVPAGQVLDASAGTFTPSAGQVVQVVSGELGIYVVTSSSSYSDIGLSATITPTSTSSKILVCLNLVAGNTNAATENYVQILRGATVISIHERWVYSGGGFTSVHGAAMFEDSPSSTSALVYKVQFKTNTGAFRVNDYTSGNANRSNLTLMEIKQ